MGDVSNCWRVSRGLFIARLKIVIHFLHLGAFYKSVDAQ